jgi:hypothetical protein
LDFHHRLLKNDGSIRAWGYNANGQCNVPAPNTGFVAVAGCGDHSLGLKADSSVKAWGTNQCGESSVPSPNTGFVAVAAGCWHSLGLKSDGSIVAWGQNVAGKCSVPLPNTGFVAIAAGDVQSLGLKGCAPGDFDCDGNIDASDYQYIRAGMGSCVAQSKYISHLRADMDHDGCITLVDYRNWLLSYRQANGKDFVPPKKATAIPKLPPKVGGGLTPGSVPDLGDR